MSEAAPDQSQPSAGDEEAVHVFPWLRASLADLDGLEFEAAVAESKSAEASELSELFRTSIQPLGQNAEPPDTAATRIAILLSAVTGMHFKPADSNEPFGPNVVWADGRRSAILSDFRAGHVDLLAELASRARHPVLRTRLADACWMLDRKRANFGAMALAGYGEIITKADKGELLFRFEKEGGALHHIARDHLKRALQLGRVLGWEKPDSLTAKGLVMTLRKRAAETRELVPLLWFADLDLDFRVSDPKEVGLDIDQVVANPPEDANSHIMVELWRLGARAYQAAKSDEDRYRCQAAAAEHLVADAEAAARRPNSAMIAAHWLSEAIAQLHGIPGKKELRTELRHRLIDIQALIPEQMSSFSHELDLKEIIESVEKSLGKASLIDKLFIFANLSGSPDPAELVRSAEESMRQHPFSSMFGAAHMDHEGKVIHRSEGAGFGAFNKTAIARQIAQTEAIRRQLTAIGEIETARRNIVSEHYLSDGLIRSLLQHSAFVPEDLVWTFSRGFLRFFQGDFTSATYILTPLLENSLRYVLKTSGHDVSIFDDATQTQEDRTISSLFEQMRAELDDIFSKPITTDIENVFLTKVGPHLRHSVSHGLLHDGTPYGPDAIYACWLMFRLCLIPLFPHMKELQLIES
jgi:hypothetical protein